MVVVALEDALPLGDTTCTKRGTDDNEQISRPLNEKKLIEVAFVVWMRSMGGAD